MSFLTVCLHAACKIYIDNLDNNTKITHDCKNKPGEGLSAVGKCVAIFIFGKDHWRIFPRGIK